MGVFSQLYMAHILMYKQGPTTCVTHIVHKYSIHGAKSVMSTQCAWLLLSAKAEIFTHLSTCVLLCVFVLLHTRACQVALSTMRECIARASFVLFRFTGVVFVERPPEAV